MWFGTARSGRVREGLGTQRIPLVEARIGVVWQGEARQGKVKLLNPKRFPLVKARRGMVRHGRARWG